MIRRQFNKIEPYQPTGGDYHNFKHFQQVMSMTLFELMRRPENLKLKYFLEKMTEQYRHTLAKYRVRVFFKGTSTIKSLLMHPKDPIPDAQKTDIIYHQKCPANNCTAEYLGETNRSLEERVSDHRNQTTSAIRNHHISTKHPRAELKDFTIINREQHPTPSSKRSTSHSYQRSITQQKYWQSQNPFSIQQTSHTTGNST